MAILQLDCVRFLDFGVLCALFPAMQGPMVIAGPLLFLKIGRQKWVVV